MREVPSRRERDKCLRCFGKYIISPRDTLVTDMHLLRINLVCDKGKGSVPRGRVYANYVSRCATERVTVLNPASFGKLVRVLFPGLKTRRLGVRGESKYHYVNFSLKGDQADLPDHPVAPAVQSFEAPRMLQNSFKYVLPSRVSIHTDYF